MNLQIELQGIDKSDINNFQRVLGSEIDFEQSIQRNTRADPSLLSVGFILAVLKLTPPLIKELTNLLTEIRNHKYFTIKMKLDDGNILIEGSVSQKKIIKLSGLLNTIEKQNHEK
jgi:hypothetical protein